MKGSPDPPKGSKAERSDGFPLKARPPNGSLEVAALVVGTEKAENGSDAEEVEAKGSTHVFSSLDPPSSGPSSKCELVLKPLRLLTGLLEPTYTKHITIQ